MKNSISILQFVSLGMSVALLITAFSSCKKPDNSLSSDTTTKNAISSVISGRSTADPWTTPATTTSTSRRLTPSTIETKAPTTTTIVTTTTKATNKNVTIPEGWTVFQIGAALEANDICSKKDYLNALNTFDFSPYHPEVTKCVPSNPNRCYKYEGYQFPDTYNFHINSDPEDVVGIMMRRANEKIIGKYSYLEMTTDQIVILASIIEIEAATPKDRRLISSVLHNRLNTGMKLQVDSATKYLTVYMNPNLSADRKGDFNSFYNTYKCAALPAGPICNPGTDALAAAVNPSKTDYYFFHSDKNGVYHYETKQEYNDRVNSSSTH